jgi:SSS family solute:Na+ symporter
MIWIAVSLYTIATIWLGWRASRQTEDSVSFWTAGRSLGAASVGLSISAGFMSVSWSCVYAVQLFYWYGLGGIWLITVPWILALGGIYLLAGKYHQLPFFSQPEMVASRFGKGSKRIVALALAFVFLVWGGAEIYVAAKLLAPELDTSVFWMVTGICIVVGIYATLGGFRAVVSTDKLQYVIVALYILTMGWLALKGIYLTKNRVLPLPETITLKSARSWTDLTGPGWLTIVIGLLAYLPGWLFETDLWIRVQAAASARQAKQGMLIAGVNALLFVGLLPLIIGVTALDLFPPLDGIAPAIIGTEGDTIFVALVQTFSPNWLAMLVAIGLLAAAMSTIDTCVNVMALSIAYDLFGLHKKNKGKRFSRYITILAVFAAGVFALNTESLWDIFYLSGGILTTSVAFPVAAVMIRNVNQNGVFWSAMLGFAGTILFYYLQACGFLQTIQPDWLNTTDLAYVVWGIVFAVGGYFFGIVKK